MVPIVTKAKRVIGRNIEFRDVRISDAEFLLSLRLSEKYRKWLSNTSASVDDQIAWIKNYKISTDQAYFVICNRDGTPVGCVRIYEPVGDAYCWGSWMMITGLPPLLALESALLLYAYAKKLGFKSARIEVRRHNASVWKFHERVFNATRVKETDLNFYYVMSQQKIEVALAKYANLIPISIFVDPYFT